MNTRTSPGRRRCAGAMGGTLVALAAAASPAPADPGYTVNLSAPPSAAVGQPIVIQASGANPPTDFFASWFDVHAIPTSVLSACPDGYLNASQVASSTFAQGGEVVANGQRENVDASGNWSMPLAFTPKVPGQFLICGYTNDGATYTFTRASLVLTVQASSTPGPVQPPQPQPGAPTPGAVQPPQTGQGTARPVNVGKPLVKRSGGALACNRGRWSNAPTRFAYAWLVDGKAQKGAGGQKLRITRKLRGHRVQCKVAASNAAGVTTMVSGPYVLKLQPRKNHTTAAARSGDQP
jgi:hypothetical protein